MFHCNLCGTAAHVRSSRYLSENTKQRYNQCQNIHCGHTFVTMETIERSITIPSRGIPVLPRPNNYDQQSMLIAGELR